MTIFRLARPSRMVGFLPRRILGLLPGLPPGFLLLLMYVLLFGTGAAEAHQILHSVSETEALSVSINYADGQAFSYESYELYAPGEATPFQTGWTDARGVICFAPHVGGDWRLRAFSEDGHGLDETIHVDLDKSGGGAPRVSSPEAGGLNRSILGLLALLGVFGLFMIIRKRTQT